jgi:hypothetical protein
MATDSNQKNTTSPVRVPLNESERLSSVPSREKFEGGTYDSTFVTVITRKQQQDPAPPKPKR